MKKFLLTVYTICIINFAYSQSDVWTKDARNMVYNELLNELVIYKDLIQEQKESIALCGLDEITRKYPMSNYQSKIEVELKRIKSSTISQCSKNIGVELGITAKANEKVESSEWTKDDKSSFYNDIVAILNNYDLTQQEKEKIGLCFVNEISSRYSMLQLKSMIDAELKKIKNDYLRKCLDSFSIKLKKDNNNKLDKKTLIGCWQSYDFTLCFFDNGSIEKRLDKGIFKKSHGKWFLESEKIILVMKDLKEEYKVTYFSGESLKLEEINSKKEYHFTKMFNF